MEEAGRISFSELCEEHSRVAENALVLKQEAETRGYVVNESLFWEPVRNLWLIIDQAILDRVKKENFSWDTEAPFPLRMAVRPRLHELDMEIDRRRGEIYRKVIKTTA